MFTPPKKNKIIVTRATCKTDLLRFAQIQFDKLWNLIDSMDEYLQTSTFKAEMATAGKEEHWKRDKNLRDILVHLYEWHQLLLNWIRKNTEGDTVPFLPAPYNWKTYGRMNVEFCEKHQDTSLYQAKEMLKKSHEEVMRAIQEFSNENLFLKKEFPWTGSTTLGAYCVSATSSHYEWALKKIKLHIKLSKP